MSRVEDVSTGDFIQVRSRWQYLKQRLKRRGVVEVDKSHPQYDMLCAIQVAIRTLFTDHPEAKAKDELDENDFNQKIKYTVQSPAGKTYQFGSYASPVFARVRSAVDIKEDDFLNSLVPDSLPYLEFISNSRSGQDFYFTNNQRFVLKTDLQHCVQFFLSILRDYLNHFQTYPHSLLVKFLGLYSIKTATSKKKYFLVMQSIFYPTIRLNERFDIKGCLANRYQDPNPPGKKTILVLKDKNFLDEKIELGPQKDWFLTQLRADVDFLREIEVLDFSLLLGRHRLESSEKHESMSNLVIRVKKSFGHEKGSENLHLYEEQNLVATDQTSQPNGQSEIVDQSKTKTNDIELQVLSKSDPPNVSPAKKSGKKEISKLKSTKSSSGAKVGFLRSLSDKRYLDDSEHTFQNRRLLLTCDNSLHIIDGVKYRYYIGVIDFFTQFRCRQLVGKVLKDMKTCCGSHSTVDPETYAERFYQFIQERVE
ncbi:phosphatidylinositol 4-phosphate 5-kinase-like protein 1 [Mya arenaria]|uniref:phosphatidylinositol 4-phosphate 5-kinase-like protein 1 n=1 Tax=Mya arenaria TaxID=6604 RepID=UPI0022DECE54|nr:phosphatidylinositol 4-phosphate 5-kinase-like protein 1 [Mya arenaria]XP_052789825.1 phosphatidylinositol 4-phosphate 5-kinase-like protein 1 [Mya arenaria]XP_052789826.1 phosphatidylinositol 4-phosphate 5-kinase-like protein 1 [Mya arenaria]